MQRALLEFFYQYHTKQHYFLCHDILEEAWKAQTTYTKKDAVVSLILLATGSYHYRRQNFKGAHTLFKRAYRVAEINDVSQLGLRQMDYLYLLKTLEYQTQNKEIFIPIHLPLTKEIENTLKSQYPNYEMMQKVNDIPFIYDHHLLRDRHEVEEARNMAYRKKHSKNKNHESD